MRCGHRDEALALAEAARRFVAAHPGASDKAIADVAAMDAALAAPPAAELGNGAFAPGAPDALTPRELDVLRRLAGPLSVREIAADLYVSPNTIKTQVRSIYRKLDVATRPDAVDRAKALALIR
jgi:DNA-binding NarL/FixJ family response regulator